MALTSTGKENKTQHFVVTTTTKKCLSDILAQPRLCYI